MTTSTYLNKLRYAVIEIHVFNTIYISPSDRRPEC
jgi:hypothetical protein